ncbi:Beta-galactosidase [Rubripirellula obstinata]|uniref:Beta-galactosidase n=1 Tax=Rubripirellula obstinata TaxID=406547 RepID=A0A5B1CIW8_9BACT|nr:sugar-binding domain-containing protein [Rubripirellula obstinata]KAA1261107.1 Beta-galactosidase [Rubripirellula obstinata]
MSTKTTLSNSINRFADGLVRWLASIVVGFVCVSCDGDDGTRVSDFNSGWKFSLQDDPLLDDPAQTLQYDDSDWRVLRLPHDWSVESPFSKDLEGCGGYLPGGVGWYRKHFKVDVGEDQLVYLCFDGVYNRAEVWINGEKLGFHPFGYSPFNFDITPYLNASGEDNVVAVKVDHSRYADSRWYTGSGIYRNVDLVTTNKLHVPVWGTFIRTPTVSQESATIEIDIDVKNAFAKPKSIQVVTKIFDDQQNVVAQQSSDETIPAQTTRTAEQILSVDSPKLWDISDPNLYVAEISIVNEGSVIDSYRTRFGIRTIRFDRDTGFSINGKPTLIKGVCLHHAAGLVGAAVPKGVWKRRFAKLIAAGCNAIRTAHNPASSEFLDLCDEMGLLVQEEFYDEWDNPKDKRLNMMENHDDRITRGHAEFFQDWAESDLKATMLRDRNHPCIFQWSIGNEIEWTYPRYREASGYFDADAKGNYFWTPPHLSPDEVRKRLDSTEPGKYVLADTAMKLSRWTKQMDTTRPVTANCILPSVSHASGYTDALDVVGYSYRRVVYDFARRNYPEKIVMGTENLGQWHEWKAVLERPFISGVFLWTGADYMGEANGAWPRKGVLSGLIDTAGFEKPSYHLMKTLWSDQPHVYLATQALDDSDYKIDKETGIVATEPADAWTRRTWNWHKVNRHWNYETGQTIVAEVYANSDRVELLLNNRSLGVKSLSDFPDRIFKWAVPFESGDLVARTSSASDQLQTAGTPRSIKLTIDRSSLEADGNDVAHVVAQVVDENGIAVRSIESEVVFEVDGAVRSLGVDNGSGTTVVQYQSDRVQTHQGRCLLIVQSNQKPGTATIRARAGEMQSNEIELRVK